MSGINFFVPENKQVTSLPVFGLCDDNDKQPAYIDTNTSNKMTKWIGVVFNPDTKIITFYPVDNCVDIKTDDNKMARRCEGIMHYDGNKLVFVELKNRQIKPTVWLKEAKEQIIETLRYFFVNYDVDKFVIKAWICNKQITNENYFTQISSFMEETKSLFPYKKSIPLHINNQIRL